jgi:hypothetical protein
MASTAPGAQGLTERTSVEDLHVTVYAPDWTWQRRDVNILMVLENKGDAPLEARLGLLLPPDDASWSYDGPTRIETSVPPRGVTRAAFTGITAANSAPRRIHELSLRIESAGRTQTLDYPVRVVRGAAVSPGVWALLLPLGVALAWCIVFALTLLKLAPAGAWRRPGPAYEPPAERPAWIEERP